MWVIASRGGPPCVAGVTWEDRPSDQSDEGSSDWSLGRADGPGRDLPGAGAPALVGGRQAPAGGRDARAGRDGARDGYPSGETCNYPHLRPAAGAAIVAASIYV